MADIASSIVKMNDVEIGQDKPLTEALFTKVGANINGLIDEDAALDTRIDALETAPGAVATSSGQVYTPGTRSITQTQGTETARFSLALTPSSSIVMLQFEGYSGSNGSSSTDYWNFLRNADASGINTLEIRIKRETTTLFTMSLGTLASIRPSDMFIMDPGATAGVSTTYYFYVAVAGSGDASYELPAYARWTAVSPA